MLRNLYNKRMSYKAQLNFLHFIYSAEKNAYENVYFYNKIILKVNAVHKNLNVILFIKI